MVAIRGITWLESFFSFNTRYIVAISRQIPWPQSPNITANRKGKVTIVNTVGLASWYLATLKCSDKKKDQWKWRQNTKCKWTVPTEKKWSKQVRLILPADLIKENAASIKKFPDWTKRRSNAKFLKTVETKTKKFIC